MTIEKVNELLVRVLEDEPLWKEDGKEAVMELAYINGACDMANIVKKQLESEANV